MGAPSAPPPEAPASAPAAQYAAQPANPMTQAEADLVLARLQGTLAGTRFTAAWPAALPGMVAVRMENGRVAYTDKAARYFFLGLVFDTSTGKALDQQMDPVSANP